MKLQNTKIPILTPMKSNDTRNKQLTDAQKSELKLEASKLKYKMNKLKNSVNIISSNEDVLDTMLIKDNDKMQYVLSIQSKIRRNFYHEFCRTINKNDKLKLDELKKSLNFDTSDRNELNLMFDKITNDDWNQLVNKKDLIGKELYCNETDKNSNSININAIINETDKIINYDNRFENIGNFKSINTTLVSPSIRYNLRSKMKFPAIYRHFQPEHDEIEMRTNLRNKFFNYIFGYRGKIEFLLPENFHNEQMMDRNTQLLYQFVKNDYNVKFEDKLDKNYWNKMNRFAPKLIQDCKNKIIFINKKNILCRRMKDKLLNKSFTAWIIPVQLIGKIIDYAHHNPYLHHFGKLQTFDNIAGKFWWPGMQRDIDYAVERCVVCQFKFGTIKHRAPLKIRKLPKPRSHIMADFAGPFFGKHYILVIIDYFSGWTMLAPAPSCTTTVVIDALLHKWVPFHGWFSTIETDLGSAFISQMLKELCELHNVEQHFAEARNHRSTGKVERIIGLIQQIIASFNIESGNELVDGYDRETQWDRVKLILPFIQFSINQRKPRFTQYSPNMILFGSNVKDFNDINLENYKNESKLRKPDFEYVAKLLKNIKLIHNKFKGDFDKYVKISKDIYDKKFKIFDKSNKDYKSFLPGKSVLYFIGDINIDTKKWRQKWSGPWKIIEMMDNRSAIVGDPKDGATFKCSIDRLKLFATNNWYDFKTYKEQILNRVGR